MDRLNSSTPSKPLVRTPIHDPLYPDLPHSRRTHNARLDRNVQCHTYQRRIPQLPLPLSPPLTAPRSRPRTRREVFLVRIQVLRREGSTERGCERVGAVREEVSESVELCVKRRVPPFVRPVPSARDDGVVVD